MITNAAITVDANRVKMMTECDHAFSVVVSGHGFKPGVDAALIAFTDLVYGGAHVVVNAALGDATQDRKSTGGGSAR